MATAILGIRSRAETNMLNQIISTIASISGGTQHNAIQNVLGMISTLEAVALLALPVATILFYRRLRRIRTSWPRGICLVVGFLAALGLIFILSFLLATIWPNLHEIQF